MIGKHMAETINTNVKYQSRDANMKSKFLLRACLHMRPEVNSNRFEISNRIQKSLCVHGNFTASNLEISNCFQKLFHLHGDFTAATLQTIYFN